ncbi:MAG: 50S ribosomal protein L2 [Candidatus Portnoybacteria bacterium]|nr:50S ribosomal protein L2 [Candidatus Portnoybacteria bacterium]
MKYYKPTSPGRRQLARSEYRKILAKKEPERSLISPMFRNVGRSSVSGRITTRHKGGGHKRLYRLIDFKRDKFDVPAKVVAIEYDPNRSSFIALLNYADGEKSYIVAANGLKIGDEILTGQNVPAKIGNRLPLKNILVGTGVHDIELNPGNGGKIVRSAGSSAQVLANEGGWTHLKMPSGEIRIVSEKCFATIGQVSNPEHGIEIMGKAGRSRWMGIRPRVRGSAMNPPDHPHGGGEGRAPIGLRRGPKTPWGKQALGVKTRKRKKWSNRFIVKRRK